MSRILIVEDETRIASFVAKGLRAEGFAPTVASDGLTGRDYALTGEFDLVVLDLGLPGMNGFEVLAELRGQRPHLPVLVLTASDSGTDTVAALEGGAADYMVKPFHFAELLARIRLRLRTPVAAEPVPDELTAGSVRLDLRRRRAYLGEREVELSARELTLAEVLMEHRGQALSRAQLLSRVWGYDFDPGSNVVDVYVGYLRRKLGADFIRTVRGVGYRVD
ncbi:response regulator transcription factor [Brevibacterium album]|uniref:response regulator transcription factor n=1 Tax=Brevibacterium album TaxID=417948 RepID=UPI0003F9A85A|nr:response regulator transcription factor [Brevibacterium album]